ncbi:MAG: ABC transporter permease subunit [Verrucomicrobiota bacterium]
MKIPGTDFLPVVQRELREGARRPFNYWLRVGGATAGVLLLYAVHKSAQGDQTTEGIQLFTSLHLMLLVLICALVPAMSADCVAREKREGTLGLLFLTPLTAMGVAVGKGMVQAFRAFTLWLAVLPVLIIPFLMGGVTGGDVFSAVTIEFCVTLLCLAAGMLASSLAKARSTAFVLAVCFGVAFVCLFAGLLGAGFFSKFVAPGEPLLLSQLSSLGESLITGRSESYLGILRNGVPVGALSRLGGGWTPYFSGPPISHVWQTLLLQSWLAVSLFCCLVLGFAARQMERCSLDQTPSLRREGWIKTCCAPLARRRFERRMRRTLEWNPIAWLQQYSWKARASKWGLCLGFVLLECAATTGEPSEILDTQYLLLAILAAAMTFAGVNSFLKEKKSGALELLLITPVSSNQIIFGRVWGLWRQFLPAGLTLLLVWAASQKLVSSMELWSFGDRGEFWRILTMPLREWNSHYHPYVPDFVRPEAYHSRVMLIDNAAFQIFVAAAGFFTLPVFATCFALRRKNLIVAAALTWLAVLFCPFFAFMVLGLIWGPFNGHLPPAAPYLGVLLSNLAFALLACRYLRRSLSRRIYSF